MLIYEQIEFALYNALKSIVSTLLTEKYLLMSYFFDVIQQPF